MGVMRRGVHQKVSRSVYIHEPAHRVMLIVSLPGSFHNLSSLMSVMVKSMWISVSYIQE